MVSKERMYSSLSGLPRVLLALLLVLRFPGENAAGPPRRGKTHKPKPQILSAERRSFTNEVELKTSR